MTEADSNAIAAAAKKRLRREARMRENYDRISAALSIHDSKSTKNPTRKVPDVPGFQSLSKTEIKRDTKDIEKNSGFSHGKERNYSEEMDNCISRSMRPHCPSETLLQKKKRRMVSWINNPELADKEVEAWKDNVAKSTSNFAHFETERDAWLNGFQDARRLLSSAIKMSVDHNKRLKTDGALLYQLIEQECGYSLRKKRNFHSKDIVDELLERQGAFESAVQEFLEVAQEAQTSAPNSKFVVPTTFLSLEEINYPGDDVYFSHKRRGVQDPLSIPEPEVLLQSETSNTENAVAESDPEVKGEFATSGKEGESNPQYSQCISDIPLPYFDCETKQVIPMTDATGDNVAAPMTEKKLNGRTRAGSLSLIKVEGDGGESAMDVEASGAADEAAADSDTAETTNPSSSAGTAHGNWSPSENTPGTSSSGSKTFTDQDLLSLLGTLQESVRMSELLATDVEFAFQDRTTCADDVSIINSILRGDNGTVKLESAVTTSKKGSSSGGGASKSAKVIPAGITEEEQRQAAAPYLALSRHHEEEWGQFVEKLFDGLNSQGIVTRKGKKRGPDYIPVTVDLRLRTQRGVNLLLSPLSQFEDRMLGVSTKDTIYQAQANGRTGEVNYVSTTQLPYYLRAAEEEALQRCNLQSRAAIADLQIRKLRSNLRDIAKFSHEAQAALRRSESIHEMASVEEAVELRKMYKELIHYGVVPACPSDPPLSPITSNAAAAAASALYNSVYAANTANNGKPGGKSSRAPARTYVRPSAATTAGSSIAPSAMDIPVMMGQKNLDAPIDSGTTSESITKNNSVTSCTSDVRSAEDSAAQTMAGVVGDQTQAEVSAETLKRKANGASAAAAAAVSAPKRRR